MKETTIKKAFGELWHTIRIRKDYYNELCRKNIKPEFGYKNENIEMNLAFKLIYEELDDQINWLINKFEKEDNNEKTN